MNLNRRSRWPWISVLLAFALTFLPLDPAGKGFPSVLVGSCEAAVPAQVDTRRPPASPVSTREMAANQSGLHFSSEPSDAEIFAARIFDEPLVPLAGPSRPEENRALADALTAYATRAVNDDCSSLAGFAKAFPDSRWTGPLLLDLGTEYYNFGYYSKALGAWERAWQTCASTQEGKAKAEADRALGELARMYSKLGRVSQLSQLLKSVEGRNLEGPATQLIGAAKGALWMMQNEPDFCFKCGPLALERIERHYDPAKAGLPAIMDARSDAHGFSLARVAELSRQAGMNYQMAFRSPGAAFIVPAVIHWKLGHYAALVERDAKTGGLLAQDYTFEDSVWMTPKAVEEEGSGYFLVPAGPLPRGWRVVSKKEGQTIFGRGFVDSQDPNATTRYDKTCKPCKKRRGMAVYDMHAMLASLIVNDQPVGYTPPVGPPVEFQADYHQKEANQPATFSYSNLGPKWTCNWVSFITDNPSSPNANVKLYVDGGGTLEFSGFNPATQSYQVEVMSQTRLVKLSNASYELQFPDGSMKQYLLSDGSAGSTRRVFLSAIIDPAGNAVQLNYDSQLRITNIVDAIGQETTLQYTNAAFPFAITAVVDPFGRAAYFGYDGSGLLTQITDVLGLSSQFTYGANQFLNSMTTPYGTTTFSTTTAGSGLSMVTSVTATDPLGQSEKVEYTQQPVIPHSFPDSEVPHGLGTFNLFTDGRNSFYWDKKEYAEGAGDYSKAKNFHWLHHTPVPTSASPILETEKEPLESRIWYNYPGQPTNFGSPYYLNAAYDGAMAKPSTVARLLDDGTTQLSTYQYNALGNVTNSIDPEGRTFTYVYDTNKVDLLEVRMTHNGKNELLATRTYNSQHEPLTFTDAAGQTTKYTYNARGQILTITDAKNEAVTFTYDSKGRVTAVDGPLPGPSDTATFTYDAFNRVLTTTDTEGYTITYSYDNLDRLTERTFPDGTSEQFVYDRLDLVAFQDRMGLWTTNTYNALRQLTSRRDPLGRITRFDNCDCGLLEAITDPMGRTTRWTYDLQGRVVAKHYPDGSTETYEYENSTGLPHVFQGAAGQQTVVKYYADNRVKSISYLNAANPTPDVSFTYDPDYPRISTMQDGFGTTTYSYYPITSNPVLGAGKLQSVTGPLPNSTVTYQYDELGRVISRAINGVAQASTYDTMNRLVAVTNALGSFHYSYVDATDRLAMSAYPNGETNLFSYYDNLGDQRLRQIIHLKPNGSLLSSFGYAYDPDGEINSWTNEWDSLPERVWHLTNDKVHELTEAVDTDGVNPISTNRYAYDAAANRTLAVVGGTTNQFAYNALNEIAGEDAGPAAATTYEWDGAHQLVAVSQGTRRSEFSYDGWGRRVRIVEKTNDAVISDRRFLWCGAELCEERDASGATVLRRFFPQGEVIYGPGGGSLFYSRDHLGSVREALDSSGALRARYDYDPYGQQKVLVENLAPSFGFAGLFQHQPTGLNLALFRALDPRLGRWLNRDPAGEAGGFNLYTYVGNNPVNAVDLYGLLAFGVLGSAEAEAGVGLGAAGQVSAGYGIASGNSLSGILGTLEVGSLFLNPFTAPAAITALVADRIQAHIRGTKPVFGIGGFVSDGVALPITTGKKGCVKGVPYVVGPGAVGGASAGAGAGLFISNATDFKQLGGPFLTWNLTTPIFGLSLGVDPKSGTFILSGTVGPSAGVSSSLYVTNTKAGQF